MNWTQRREGEDESTDDGWGAGAVGDWTELGSSIDNCVWCLRNRIGEIKILGSLQKETLVLVHPNSQPNRP